MAVAPPGPPRPRAASGGRIFIIIGAVLALMAFGAVFVLSTLGGGKVGVGTGPVTHVVYAAKDIALRTQIVGTDQLEIKDIPSDVVAPGAFTVADKDKNGKTLTGAELLAEALKLVQSDIAEVNISKDQPLLANFLAKPGDTVAGVQAAFLPIPTGYVAFTIPTSEQTGVAGFPQAGDYISIIATVGSAKKAAAAIVFSNLRILRVGPANLTTAPASGSGSSAQPAASSQPAQTANATSLTVITTPCDASYLRWFQNNAQVTYILESYLDYAKAPAPADAGCNSVSAAKAIAGIKADDIIAKFPAFSQALSG